MERKYSFGDLQFKERKGLGVGVAARLHFPNGYGVSVIRGPYSYGGESGLYELAVLHDDDLCYDTPIADDVLGYLSEEQVTEAMQQVADLPAISGDEK